MIQRLLPAPMLSAALVVLWLLLNGSLGAGQVLLALLFGLGAPALLAPLRPTRVRVRHPLVIARYIGVVGRDVLRSSVEVFTTLARNRSQPVHSRFVVIPLDLRDPGGLAALAMVTTVVPGTVWCELARDGSQLLLHVWHAPDVDAFIAHYKHTYEHPLMEIFEA